MNYKAVTLIVAELGFRVYRFRIYTYLGGARKDPGVEGRVKCDQY
jgi:hypothetical protein